MADMSSSSVVDVVRIRRLDGWTEICVLDFFRLPLSTRIRHVVERTVEFKKGGDTIDPHAALAELRRLQAA